MVCVIETFSGKGDNFVAFTNPSVKRKKRGRRRAREARGTLRCVPCILVRILDNPVCFSGCLSTTHVPAEQTFPWSCRGGGFVVGSASAAVGERSPEGCSAVPPPRTRCHQAQLGTSLGHQRVYHGFPSRGCVRVAVVGANPRDGASFSRRTISLLNSVSFPYVLCLGLSLSSVLLRSTPCEARCSRLRTPACDYSRYTSLTQLCFGPYDVSLTLPTPCGDATLPKVALPRQKRASIP